MRKTPLTAILLFLFIASTQTFAGMDDDISFILKAKHPPKGVVFEIVEGKQEDLNWAIPKVQEYSDKLRKTHPGIQIAVVSHGSEQFGLMKENQNKLADTHKRVQSLVSSDVPIHVCGTHASWYHKGEKDFPDYIDVVPAGPTKINEYQRMGYALVEMEKPREN